MTLPANYLRLFGTVELIDHGQTVDLARARLDELVAYLAIRRGEPCPRSQIAYTLWADSNEKQARTNLRHLIFNLRKNWPLLENVIAIERAALRWRSDADTVVDIHLFEQLLGQAIEAETVPKRTQLLTEAASLFRGDLLPNCYEDWILTARQRLREQFGQAVEMLIDGLLDLRHYDQALDWSERLLAHDPLQESIYRRLMQSHVALGNRSIALRIYHDCAEMLRTELGVEPSAATMQVYERLLGKATPAMEPVEKSPSSTPRPRLVGRVLEWQALLAAWRRAEAGRSGMVLIEGEAGIGKTRLAEELIDWVARQGHSWAGSRSYAVRGAIAYAPVSEWLQSPHLGTALANIDDLWRVEVHRLLPELAVGRPELPLPGPIAEDWQRHRFYQAIAQTLKSCPAPLLLHLDDIQWADPETLAFLHFLLQSLSEHPLLVVCCARSEEVATNEALVRLLQDLRRDLRLGAHVTELTLGPLSAADVRALAEQTAGLQIDGESAASLFTSSEGHPLLLIETIRANAPPLDDMSDGKSFQASFSAEGPNSMPAKVFAIMGHRLNQLSVPTRKLAELAAVIGRDFSIDLLRQAGAYNEDEIVKALDELWQRRIVRHQRGDEYDFSHDRLREAAYQQVSPPRRQSLHRRVAQAMVAQNEQNLDTYAGQIAVHYEIGGERSLACANYIRAAQAATRQHALSSADEFYDGALRLVPRREAVQRLQLLQEQARIFPSLGQDIGRWRRNLDMQDAIVREESVDDSARLVLVQLCRADYYLYSDAYSESAQTVESAIQRAQEANDTYSQARGHLIAGLAYWFQSKMTDARAHFTQAIHFGRLAGDRGIEAKALENVAAAGVFSGALPGQLHEYLHRALLLAEETGNRLIEASIYNKLGFQAYVQGLGDWAASEQHFRHGLAIAQETGERPLERLILANLGVLDISMGNYRRAAFHFAAADAVGDKGQQVFRAGYAQNYLARSFLHQGRLDEALGILTPAVAELQASKHLHGEVRARSDLGFLLYQQGNYDRARRALRSALELARQYGDTRQEASASVRLGYVEDASHRWDEAGRAYLDGYECHTRVEQHYHALNGLAGLARVAHHRGEHALAQERIGRVWETVRHQQVDATSDTAITYRICHELFIGHADLRAISVFEAAWRQLKARAETIDDPNHVALFWQLPDHQYFLSFSGGSARRD